MERRWSWLAQTTQAGLTKNYHGSEVLIIRNPDDLIGDVRWGKGTLGPDSKTHQDMVRVCRKSITAGLFCHEDMFVWGHALLDRVEGAVRTLRGRFPLVFMDEAQDNDEEQSAILHRVFCAGESPVIRQRFGDSNQAIFHSFDADREAKTDVFPCPEAVHLSSSPRFGPEIGRLAAPLAFVPEGLSGCGPRRPLALGSAAKHTVFLFTDKTVEGVLDAYGALLLQTFSGEELCAGIFTAVGQVHRPGTAAKQYPHDVAHYWREYLPEVANQHSRPRTFPQCLMAAVSAARSGGESFLAVDKIAAGILRLSDPRTTNTGYGSRRHRAICDALRGSGPALKAYRELIDTFAIRLEPVTFVEWENRWRGVVALIAGALPDTAFVPKTLNTHPFLAWTSSSATVGPPIPTRRGNLYPYPPANPKILIRCGSIHSVKGETHTATLILETFWHKRNLESLLPWIDGRKSGGTDVGPQIKTRMKLHYDAPHASALPCVVQIGR